VHDVVFRVRFGGYDEWQVDLHLDRVERQLAELEERGGYGRELRKPPPDRLMPAPPDRMGPPERMGPPVVRDERIMPPGPPPGSTGPLPPMPGGMPPAPAPVPPMVPPGPPPGRPVPAGPPPQGFGRFDDSTFAGQPGQPSFGGGPGGPGGPPPPFEEFEPGRHGKSDMTTEIRMPEPSYGGGPALTGEAQRIDQLRRTFQLRRFGSGYDRTQVDRLFETLVNAVSGRSPVNDAELDPSQFNLVPGGYFEAEVDAALKEVRDILGRRR
jgi:DivIVA domain-containing protein